MVSQSLIEKNQRDAGLWVTSEIVSATKGTNRRKSIVFPSPEPIRVGSSGRVETSWRRRLL